MLSSLWGSVMKWVYTCHTKLITDAKAMWFSTPSKNVWHFSLKIIKDWVSFLIWFRYGTNIVEWLLVKKEVPHTSSLKWWPSLRPPALLDILIIQTTLSTYKILGILWIFSWASFGLYIALGLWQAEGCWLLSQAMICEDSIQQSRSEDRSGWWQAWAGGTQAHSPLQALQSGQCGDMSQATWYFSVHSGDSSQCYWQLFAVSVLLNQKVCKQQACPTVPVRIWPQHHCTRYYLSSCRGLKC